VLEGVIAYFHADSVTDVNADDDPFSTSCWVLLARHPGTLNIKGLENAPHPATMQVPARLWTDDYSDIFRLIQ
jgi:hypothetical protein